MDTQLSLNSTISHYRIVSKIGAGGMGEVYLAQDTKLDRKVALKILPAELGGNQDRMRRFTQEAKATAALNHPNIATIYKIGESDAITSLSPSVVPTAPSSAEYVVNQMRRHDQRRRPDQRIQKMIVAGGK